MSDRIDTVLRYFRDAIDGNQPTLVREMFTEGCTIHRPEVEFQGVEKLVALISKIATNYEQFHTHVHQAVEGDDTVVLRLTHSAMSTGLFVSRTGIYDVSGKPIKWDAIAMFRFQDDRIAEEWVNRDELGMHLMYDILKGDDSVTNLIHELIAGDVG